VRPVRRADNLTTICEPIMQTPYFFINVIFAIKPRSSKWSLLFVFPTKNVSQLPLASRASRIIPVVMWRFNEHVVHVPNYGVPYRTALSPSPISPSLRSTQFPHRCVPGQSHCFQVGGVTVEVRGTLQPGSLRPMPQAGRYRGFCSRPGHWIFRLA
jgi:hypothetical protein